MLQPFLTLLACQTFRYKKSLRLNWAYTDNDTERQKIRKHEVAWHSSTRLSLTLQRSAHGRIPAAKHSLNHGGHGCLKGKTKIRKKRGKSCLLMLPQWIMIRPFQLLLQRLEESIPGSSQEQIQSKVGLANLEETLVEPHPKTDMRDYLSARNLRTVRQDSKRYSGCFGSKLDRIGSMSSLGCNTVRRSGNEIISISQSYSS